MVKVRCGSLISYSLQNDPIMVQNPVYKQFAERFASASLQSLVDSFNREVGQYAWHYSRSLHDAALIDEFVRRGIDISAIHDGKSTSFAHRVVLNDEKNKLVIAEGK